MVEGFIQTARAVSEAALATEGVYSLGKGTFAEAATYGAGEKVSGVVVDDENVEVHIVLSYPLAKPIPELARDIQKKIRPRSSGRRTTVVFEDVAVSENEGIS